MVEDEWASGRLGEGGICVNLRDLREIISNQWAKKSVLICEICGRSFGVRVAGYEVRGLIEKFCINLCESVQSVVDGSNWFFVCEEVVPQSFAKEQRSAKIFSA